MCVWPSCLFIFSWCVELEFMFFNLDTKALQYYDFALTDWTREIIIPLVLLRSRLSSLSTWSISLTYCAGHRMGHWSYRGFMRWCTSDGSASGWVWPSGRWVVPALDASWLQAFYDFWHTYENSHFKPYLTFDKSCVSRPNFWLLRRGPQARVLCASLLACTHYYSCD